MYSIYDTVRTGDVHLNDIDVLTSTVMRYLCIWCRTRQIVRSGKIFLSHHFEEPSVVTGCGN